MMKIPDNSLSSLMGYFKQSLSDLFEERELDANLREYFYQAFGLNRSDLLLSKDLAFSESEMLKVFSAVKKLKTGQPLAYVLEQKEFYGLKLKVNESVLIPRPETEELVDWIIKDVGSDAKLQILDIGAGSGCIALALKKNLSASKIWGIDNSMDALEVARENSKELKLDVEFGKMDFLNEGPEGLFDLIVSNPPYIAKEEENTIEKNVLEHEPYSALFVKKDPLIFYRRMMEYSMDHLRKSASMYWEINQKYAEELLDLLRQKNFRNVELRKDLNDNYRMIKCMPPL